MKCFASTKISLVLAGIIAIIMSATAFGYTVFVDDNAWGGNVGTDWNNALRSLQEAIAVAYFLPKPVEIRVADGIYKPDHGIGIDPGDQEMPFYVLSGVIIKGGYAGRSYSSNPDARDIKRYKTILSGDLLGNDRDVDNLSELAETRSDNSYTVVVSIGVDESAVLDGVTIRGGYNNVLLSAFGAGMYNGHSSPTIINCVFEDNFAGDNDTRMGNGAGMFNYYSSPKLINCTFRENCVGYEGPPSFLYPGAQGGGIFNFSSSPVLTGCVFDRNISFDVGGAMADVNSVTELTNCTFNANVVGGGWAGAMFSYESDISMTNCLFTLNAAPEGGAVYADTSVMTITNCTFAGNVAASGSGSNGFWCDSYFLDPPSSLDFTNCILWDGEDQILNEDGSDITINYSDVQGGWSGSGANNINTDPLFAAPGYWVHIDDPNIVLEAEDPNAVQFDGDYHLKSQAGRYDPNCGCWVLDDVTSPCIDAGDPTMPVGDEPEPNGGIINMGAYGGTAQASMSLEH